MKRLLDFIQENLHDLSKLGNIYFELDESSIELLSDDFKKLITEGCYISFGDIISEMAKYPEKYKKDKSHGNRPVWKSKDGDALKIGDHATQREDRPVEKGGDGEHIDEEEIVNMFIYAWNDIIDMYYDGYLKHSADLKSFVILCKCYLKGTPPNIEPDGARPENKWLWAAWMINENYNTGKLDIIIRTIFRGSFFKHGKVQERIVIANNGYIKQKLPK